MDNNLKEALWVEIGKQVDCRAMKISKWLETQHTRYGKIMKARKWTDRHKLEGHYTYSRLQHQHRVNQEVREQGQI